MNQANIVNKSLIAFVVSLALFMDAIDTTVLNTAIPSMARSLNVTPVDVKIALITYLLSLAVFIPVSGWIGNRFGIKRVFITALALFTVSSLACGFATNLHQLVIARCIQGIGGSLMLPLGRLTILHTFQKHEVVNAMNHIIMVVSLGLMIGPLAGGFITEHFSWPWIFWINIPVGAINLLLEKYALVDSPPQKTYPLDFVGFLLFGGGLAGLLFSLSELSESESNKKLALILFGVSLLTLIFYFIHARYKKHPIVNVTLFLIRTFRISMTGNLCARLGMGGVPFLLPLLLQVSLGFSAQLSGLLLVPIAVGIMIVRSIVLHLLRFFGYRRLLLMNTLCVGLATWAFTLINVNTPTWLIAIFTLLFGILIAIQFNSMNSLAYAEIPQENLSDATSIVSTAQQLAQSFGVAVGALLLYTFSGHNTTHAALTPHVFHESFFALGTITLLTSLVFLGLKPNDGHQMLVKPPDAVQQAEQP